MASKTVSAKRTGWRIARWFIALPLLVMLLTFLLAGWLTTSESGARAAFSMLRAASGGLFAADDVHGRLLGPLLIGKLTIRQTDSDLNITQLQLEWQPQALQDGVLHIRLLRAANVQFSLHPQSPQPPPKWQSPLQLRLDKLAIARVQIEQDARPVLTLHKVEGQLQFDGQRIRQAALNLNSIELAQLQRTWPESRFNLQAQLDTDGSGKLSLQNLAVGRFDQSRLPLRRAIASFQLTDNALLLSDLQLDAGPGAQLQGSASMRAEALTVVLDTQALNLRQLDARLRATHLSGRASLTRTTTQGQSTQFKLSLSEPWQQAALKLTAQASLNATKLTVTTARLEHGKASASFSGMLDFSDAGQFSVHGSFKQLHPQDFAQLGHWPSLLLNGDFDAEGKRAAPAAANVEFSIVNSRLQAYPLAGKGKLVLAAGILAIPHLHLTAGANQLRVHGELRESASQLDFSIEAPQLAQLGPQFGGALHLTGSASGTLDAPLVKAEWQVRQLTLPGAIHIADAAGKTSLQLAPQQPFLFHTIETSLNARNIKNATSTIGTLQLKLQASMAMNAPLLLELSAQKMAFDQLRIEQAQLQLAGTLHSHTIALDITRHGMSHKMAATSSLTGLDKNPAWRGHVESLQLSALLALFEQSAVQFTDVALAGEWDLQLQTPLQGTLALRRQSGDVLLRSTQSTTQSTALGLQQFDLAVRARGDRLNVTLAAEGRQLGLLSFKGSSAMVADQVLQVDPHAAIDGQLTLQLPSINWIGALLSSSLLAEGSVRGDLRIAGSWSEPQLNGHIAGQQLRLLLVDSGIHFQRGVLDAEFAGNTLTLRQLQFAGTSGQINVSGPLIFSDGKLATNLAIHATQFGIYDRSDRQLVISGDAKLALAEGRARLDGNVIVDRGVFDIGRAGTPQLSDDVIVTGSPQQAQRALQLDLDVGVGLGKQLVLRGRGLDARMEGALRFTSKAGGPLQTFGLMQVSKGSYTAYGRELSIERGILRFDGAAGNPALDIRAMRRGTEVEPGVAIVGSALAPRIALVSEPQVPEAEKLAWLVLGHGLASSGGNELGDLQGAAASLLSQGAAAGIQAQLASVFGLDTISLSSQSKFAQENQDTVQERIITLGKRVSSRLYVSYQQGLQSAAAVVLLRYTLSPRLTVEAESGTRSVFSLFYNLNFD